MALLQTRGSGRQAPSADRPIVLRPDRGDLAGLLLACLVGLAFCSGLIALAVLPSQGVAVPRWVILAYGFGCVLLALAAPLLSRRGGASRPVKRP
jgi:hypothetical protein